MKIAVMGAGAFGTALGEVLLSNGYEVEYYDAKMSDVKLGDVVEGAEVIVLAVPSVAAPYLLPHLPKDIPLVVATKGILSVDVFKDFQDYMILSGPGFADDIKAGKKTHLVATDERIVQMFGTDYLTFDYTEDRQGVLMCGALKNVYAIAAGLLGLKPGEKAHTNFLRDVAREMKLILAANGALADTVDLPCGKGDLKITCAEPSRNYEYGVKLVQNPKYLPEKTVEGLSALKKIQRGEIVVPKEVKYLRELMTDDRLKG